MTRPHLRGLLWAGLAVAPATACYEGRTVPPIREDAVIAQVQQVGGFDVDALLPTDLLVLDGGERVLLDSYRKRMVVTDDQGAALRVLEDGSAWGDATRLSPGPDGSIWLSNPGGYLVRIDPWGSVLDQLLVVEGGDDPDAGPGMTWAPVDVHDTGVHLLVADRHGGLGMVDRTSGQVLRRIDAADDAVIQLGIITDLVPLGDSTLAVDATSSAVHTLDPFMNPPHSWGRFGHWLGGLAKPKSVAVVDDQTLLVADSLLGVVQLFDVGGDPLGGLGVEGELLRFEHPVAVRRGSQPDRFLVLDSGAGRVVELELTAAAVAQARQDSEVRSLRTRLVDDVDETAAGACVQCHDGLVIDGRVVFDETRGHHPVGVAPEGEIPAFFQLDDEGKLECATCHSPHGSSTLDEVQAATEAGGEAPRQAVVGGTFLRVSTQDDALCKACHGDTAHESALETMQLPGGAHPSGAALRQALAKRPDGQATLARLGDAGCDTCHAVHGADPGDGLPRGGDDGASCLTCHEAQADPDHNHALARFTGHSRIKPRASAGIALDAQGGMSCTSCHALVGGQTSALLRSPGDGGLLCTACHGDRARFRKGGHGKVKGAHGTPCLACHDLHGADADHELLRLAGKDDLGDPQGCLSCHDTGRSAAVAGVAPGRRGHPVAGATTASGEALTCDTCHDAHQPEGAHDLDCAGCHEEQGAAALVSVAGSAGHGGMACLECHPAHGTAPMEASLGLDLNPRSAACLSCHGDTTGRGDAPRVTEYEHPAPVFDLDGKRWSPLGGLQLYAADGSPVATGENGALTCATCHTTHGPDAAHPRDKLRRGGWQEACASCHGDDALLLYRTFHRTDRRPDHQEAP